MSGGENMNQNLTSVFVTGLILLVSMGQAHAKKGADHTVEVAEGVYSYGDPKKGYYSMFVVTSDGVIAIEPVNIPHAEGFLKAIKETTPKNQKNRLLCAMTAANGVSKPKK